MLLPLAGALCALLAGRRSARLATAVTLATLAGTGAVLVVVAPHVFDGHVLFHQVGGWLPVDGAVLGIGWAADSFGLTYALCSVFVGFAVVLSGSSEVHGFDRGEAGRLWCLTLLLMAGLVGAALTADLFNLFVWFELAAVASYGLTGFHLERPTALEGAFKIAVLTTIAGFLVFIGVGLVYSRTGALNFGQIHGVLAHRHAALGVSGAVGIGLLIVGFGTKAGLVPFRTWLPDAHSVAPGPVSSIFSGVMVTMGLVAIARLAYLVLPPGTLPVLGVLTAIGLASALVGSALAFAQDDLKRLLAYDTVAQMGIVAISLGTGSAKGVAGATWQLLNHGLFKALLFGVAGMIAHSIGTTSLDRMGGLWREHGLLALLFGIGVAAIIGVPPLNGYASRVLIHGALVDEHAIGLLLLVDVAEVLSAAALLRAGWQVFLARPASEVPQSLAPTRAASRAGGVALAVGCLVFGLVPARWLAGMAAPAAAVLTAPGRYATAVTGAHEGGALAIHRVPLRGAFTSTEVLVSTAVVLLLGASAAWWRVRTRRDPLPIRLLRRVHTGSVNDDATALAAGLLVVALAMVR